MSPGSVHTNLELKARIASPKLAAALARECGAQFQRILIQRDTYFRVGEGRMKLREIEGAESELICYLRDDSTGVKVSHYTKDRIQHVDLLKRILGRSLGVLAVIDKRRELFLYENARIHLDDVAGLGSFLEFEIVEGEQNASENLMQFLCNAFHIKDSDVVKASYSDMILAETQGNST